MNKKSTIASVQKGANQWGEIYMDGQKALADAQARVRKIRRGLNWVRNQMERGEPLPDSLKEILTVQHDAQPQNA